MVLQEIKYLTDEHLMQLEKDVNEYIKAGWTVVGSVKHFADRAVGPMAQGTVFCQTIGLYKDVVMYREGTESKATQIEKKVLQSQIKLPRKSK